MTCRNRTVLNVVFLIFLGGGICKQPTARTDLKRFPIQLRPDGIVFVRVGDETLLPCASETLEDLSLEDLRVEWERADSKILVRLYDGEKDRPGSENNVYINRTRFSTEDVAKGNYSLLLRNVTTDDAGNYTCRVHAKEKSMERTVTVSVLERFFVTGASVVSGNVGEEVVLNCSVDSHIPPEKLEEVTWKRADNEILVLLYQDNEVLPDSSDELYRGRAEFFTSEIPKGNFSLRLKDVRTEDKGKYICEAHSGHLSAHTTVILQSLGWSLPHIMVLLLCIAAVILACVGTILVYLENSESSSALWTRAQHMILVIALSVIMFIAFVLWGVIEGHQGEVATCSILNLIRFILLFRTSQYHDNLTDIKNLAKNAYFLEYLTITTVLTWIIFYNIWNTEGESKVLAFMGIMSGLSLHMGIKLFFGGKGFLEVMDFFFLFTVSFGSRTLKQDVFENMFSAVMGVSLVFWFLLLIERIKRTKRYAYLEQSKLCQLGYFLFVLLMRFVVSTVIYYYFLQILEHNEDLAGFLLTVALLHLLALCGIYDCLTETALPEKPKRILYIYGGFVLIIVNSIALALELVLKSRSGKRSVADLRVVVLPFEFGFVLGWMVLWSCAYWRSCGERIRGEVGQLGKGFTHWKEELQNAMHNSQPAAASNSPQISLREQDPDPEIETEFGNDQNANRTHSSNSYQFTNRHEDQEDNLGERESMVTFSQ